MVAKFLAQCYSRFPCEESGIDPRTHSLFRGNKEVKKKQKGKTNRNGFEIWIEWLHPALEISTRRERGYKCGSIYWIVSIEGNNKLRVRNSESEMGIRTALRIETSMQHDLYMLRQSAIVFIIYLHTALWIDTPVIWMALFCFEHWPSTTTLV